MVEILFRDICKAIKELLRDEKKCKMKELQFFHLYTGIKISRIKIWLGDMRLFSIGTLNSDIRLCVL